MVMTVLKTPSKGYVVVFLILAIALNPIEFVETQSNEKQIDSDHNVMYLLFLTNTLPNAENSVPVPINALLQANPIPAQLNGKHPRNVANEKAPNSNSAQKNSAEGNANAAQGNSNSAQENSKPVQANKKPNARKPGQAQRNPNRANNKPINANAVGSNENTALGNTNAARPNAKANAARPNAKANAKANAARPNSNADGSNENTPLGNVNAARPNANAARPNANANAARPNANAARPNANAARPNAKANAARPNANSAGPNTNADGSDENTALGNANAARPNAKAKANANANAAGPNENADGSDENTALGNANAARPNANANGANGNAALPKATQENCVCVPPGSCPSQTNLNDGAGVLNARILTTGRETVRPSEVSISPDQRTYLISFARFSNKAVDKSLRCEPTITKTTGTCKWGLVKCCRPSQYVCGERFNPPMNSPQAVYGDAPYGSYPWMSAILEKTTGRYVAGGALIDCRHILTAAHKIYRSNSKDLRIRLGDWNAREKTEPIPPQDFEVSRIFVHRNFSRKNLFNNIAIIRLSRPVRLGETPTIGAACLSRKTDYKRRCYVSGWGQNELSGGYSNILKHVRVELQGTTTCQSQLRRTMLGTNFQLNKQSFVCAGGSRGRDACAGDGGSPLVCDMGGRWSVLGIVAWGMGCGNPDVPGVYVRVPTYIDWINMIVNSK